MLLIIDWRVAVIVAAFTGACSSGAPRPNPLLSGVENPPERVREGCKIARVRCTRCHTIDRPLRAHVENPQHWQRYVRRMRLHPGSGISSSDEKKIIRCLVFRSFGNEGLKSIEKESK